MTYEPKPGDVLSYSCDWLHAIPSRPLGLSLTARFIPEGEYSDPWNTSSSSVRQWNLGEATFLILEVFPKSREKGEMAHVLLDSGDRGLLFFDLRSIEVVYRASDE